MHGDVVLLGSGGEGEGVVLEVGDFGAADEVASVSTFSLHLARRTRHLDRTETDQLMKMYCPARAWVCSFLIWTSQTLLGWRMTCEARHDEGEATANLSDIPLQHNQKHLTTNL